MESGFHLGPDGQIVEVRWTSGPGRGHSCLMYSIDGSNYLPLYYEVEILLRGFMHLV